MKNHTVCNKKDYTMWKLPENLYRAVYKSGFDRVELSLMLYFIDCTYSWEGNNKFAESYRHISKMIGFENNSHKVKLAIQRLEFMNCIEIIETKQKRGGARLFKYQAVTDFMEWKIQDFIFQSFISADAEAQPERIKRRLESKMKNSGF